MFLTTLLALGSPAVLFSRQALATPDIRVPKVVHHPTVTRERPGAPKTLWYRLPNSPRNKNTSPLTLDPSITGIGIGITEWSPDLIPDRNFLVTTLFVLENIYNTRPNASEIVTTPYVYTSSPQELSPNFTALNISAVGRGREAGLPITFDNAALVMFMRFLGHISPRPAGLLPDGRTHRWCRFRCQFSWEQGGVSEGWDVAEGNFTALPYVPYWAPLKPDME